MAQPHCLPGEICDRSRGLKKHASIVRFPESRRTPRVNELEGKFIATFERLKRVETYKEKRALTDHLQRIVDECRLLLDREEIEQRWP